MSVLSAPGKVILFGEHAVVLGKTSVATGLSLRSNIQVETPKTPEQSQQITLSFPDIQYFGVKSYDLSRLRSLPSYHNAIETKDNLIPFECDEQFQNELAGIADSKGIQTMLFLYSAIAKLKHGIYVHFQSDLPMGAGLGSSAGFCVCIVTVLLSMFDIYACGGCEQCTSFEKVADTDTETTISFTPCQQQLELINKWSLQGEKIMHGTPSGVDNAVSTFGRALTFTRKDGYKILDRIPPLRLLIVDTKVSRSTKVLVENVINRHKTYPTLIEPVAQLIDTISNQCIEAFNQYFTDNDMEKLQKAIELMIDMNHSLLTGCFGVGHSTLDKIATIARLHGVHAKLTGAGGGGCAIVLLRYDMTEGEVSRLRESLKEAGGFESWEATIGDKGVQVDIINN
ncbi:mevalonate kinase [Cavenderia fasciculata]|uniref:Mevalonate kinase n=1 Tax=Cavenderia fasciculata TaxID=261658 RepID=F4QDQ9_CACFS|nr:mevalonate kinase [Cavenderia fasciculata]EGG13856.1 mevalonate kinase [Cavenderia fasciculata]|eukprot:XP_004350564.1 mevalonate kinase [Cavenderia fasciculata]